MRALAGIALATAGIICGGASSEAAVTETNIYSFTGNADGGFPHGGVIADPKGDLYGVTTSDGANHNGVIYELKRNAGGGWTQVTLYAFTGGNDGSNPQAALMRDSSGNLYGTTYAGGPNGAGVVFKLTPRKGRTEWKYRVLWAFTGGNDGGEPSGSLIMDGSGNLYGTTTEGGTGVVGTVFELSPTGGKTWTEQVLYNFTGNSDGGEPMGNVLLGLDGSLYGTTAGYGQYNYGTVYRLTAPGGGNGWGFSVLHAFQGSSDGEVPRDGLVQDSVGKLYGTTAGFAHSYGNVFELNPDGTDYQVIYTIPGGQGFTGNGPWQTVSIDDNGTLYGTTYADGSSSYGEVFQLKPPRKDGKPWKATVLYTFQGGAAGQYPYSNVLIGKKHTLYGTTYGFAGQAGFYPGTVWQLTR